jgi:hypothetical protein
MPARLKFKIKAAFSTVPPLMKSKNLTISNFKVQPVLAEEFSRKYIIKLKLN